MQDELQNYMMRPKRYDNIDGTGEMGMGLFLLGYALVGYLKVALSEYSTWGSGIPGFLLMLVGLIFVPYLVQWFCRIVKRRITWPRTGYVAFRHDGKPLRLKFIIAVVVAVVAGVSAYLIAHRHHGATSLGRIIYLGNWVPLYVFWIARMGGNHPWKWLLALFMALGLVALDLSIPGNFINLSRPVMLFVGLIWLISGGGTLISYLRHAQPPVEEAE